jgi:hypothetical protein
MNADRKRFLRRSLASQLDTAAVVEDKNPLARPKWLVEQLENYIERWLGCLAAFSQTGPPAGDDELFGMIRVGAELLGEELMRAKTTADNQANWRDFVEALDGIRNESGSQRPNALREALAVFRAKLTGSSAETGRVN